MNKYFVIPIVNVDGSTTILNEFKKTGKLIHKRKNNNRDYEKAVDGVNCSLEVQGVDINRNYGYLFGNNETICSDAYPGPFPFSEPESRAIRDFINSEKDTIKFVYNFHSFGPLFLWPYNG